MKSLLRPLLTFNTTARMYDYLMIPVAVKGSCLAEIIAPLLPGQERTSPQFGTPLKGQSTLGTAVGRSRTLSIVSWLRLSFCHVLPASLSDRYGPDTAPQ